MIDYSDVDSKLDEYSDAFDFYMTCGEMPPGTSLDDPLVEYMKEVIDNNPQISETDPIWVEVLKESLLSYFAVLLEQFCLIQEEAMREMALAAYFEKSDIEEKRRLWRYVTHTIENEYSKFEVNLSGYTKQFSTEDDIDSVFAALISDWRDACLTKLVQQERKILEQSKRDWEHRMREAGTQDYQDRKELDNYFYRYPKLREIIDIIGRDKKDEKKEVDTVIYKFLPSKAVHATSVEEIDRIENGNNLERVLPVELAMPDDLFYKKYSLCELQQFSALGKDKPRKIEEQQKDSHLIKGPIIISIDTSGSMSGEPQKIAFSLLRQVLAVAKREKRPCYLITFSVRIKTIDLSKAHNWRKIDEFLSISYSGGTCGEEMLSESICVLHSGTFEMSDVLIISDLEFPLPKTETMTKIKIEQSLGTKFYALLIGDRNNGYDKVLDKIWKL